MTARNARVMAAGVAALALGALAACSGNRAATPMSTAPSGAAVRFRGEVWADNWFASWVDERKVAEDSVPFATERSFNAETFTFEASYPFRLNFVVRDYIADDSGLEYVGTPRQQIGDGGFIAQVTDTVTGKVVAVTDAGCRCTVIHTAPLDPGCATSANPSVACRARIVPEPTGWKAPGFDTSSWPAATVYTEAQVGVKGGYSTVRWDPRARLVWSSDLKLDNTLLCTVTVTGPTG